MRMGIIALCVVGAFSVASAQPAYRDPPRAWTTGFGQGVSEAIIRNNQGASFNVSCASGSGFAGQGATFFFTIELPRRQPRPAAQNLDAIIEIDGTPYNFFFNRDRTVGREVNYVSRAYNFRVTAQFEEVVRALRRGRSFTVYVVPDRVMQRFSLSGARAALDGFESLEGC